MAKSKSDLPLRKPKYRKMSRFLFVCLVIAFSLAIRPEISIAQTPIDLDAKNWTGNEVMRKTLLDPSNNAKTTLEKAASVKATERQMRHHQDEFTAFVHFGPNTFSGVEWGSGKENVQVFHPQSKVDTDQWCRIFKAAGMKKVVMTVKHHDGFCLWQTKYNDSFGVRATKWKNGNGDVLRSLSKSCKNHGLKLGIYLSPADLYQIESKTGLYGNGSASIKSVIPTDPNNFKKKTTQLPANHQKHLPVFEVVADDYNRYFMNQLYELLTEFGPIEEVWFDGAHPKRKGGQQYKKLQWFRMIRHLAPNAVIFGGPDVRWCGNESGRTRESEWSVLTFQDESSCGEDRPAEDIASDKMVTQKEYKVYGKPYQAKFLSYNIAETDVSIRNGWFWRNPKTQSVRSADNVFDMYERSVGGGSVLLLNVPPNRLGRIDLEDEACLKEVGRRIQQTYKQYPTKRAKIRLSNRDPGDDLKSFSFQQEPAECNSLQMNLDKPTMLNRIVITEDIHQTGQRVGQFELAVRKDSSEGFKIIHTGTTIGYKRIVRFPDSKITNIRFRVLSSRGPAKILSISGYHYEAPIPSLIASPNIKSKRRSSSWELQTPAPSLSFNSHSKGIQKPSLTFSKHPVFFTLDGTIPNKTSAQYQRPIKFPNGGLLTARILKQGNWGPILRKRIPIPTTTMEIRQQQAKKIKPLHLPALAIDGKTDTCWMAEAVGKTLPNLEIKLPNEINLHSLRLSPYSNPKTNQSDGFSMVRSGLIQTSTNGTTWNTIKTFEFSNLKNDPSPRLILLDKLDRASRLRIVPMKTVDGGRVVSFSEVEIFQEFKTDSSAPKMDNPPPSPPAGYSPVQKSDPLSGPTQAAFEPFSDLVKTKIQGPALMIESKGIPKHDMMVGIKSWQQQVPIPQPFVGENAWKLPLNPKLSDNPISVLKEPLRGAIAIAVNGVPIFCALNNRGEDTFAAGELDNWGGHCGRGDDYHYHTAPLHLEKQMKKRQPIAYGLDGFPILGLTELDGTTPNALDSFNGHQDSQGRYHYHASESFPYINGGLRGVVAMDGDQIRQPKDSPIRPPLSPLRGATIIGFTRNGKKIDITYNIDGVDGHVKYETEDNKKFDFTYQTPEGITRKVSYTRGSNQSRFILPIFWSAVGLIGFGFVIAGIWKKQR